VEAARDALERPRPRIPLEGPNEETVAVSAGVERRVRVAEDGQLSPAGLDLLDGLGEHVLVLQGDDRQLDAGELGHLP
jgi:hypothetical protein